MGHDNRLIRIGRGNKKRQMREEGDDVAAVFNSKGVGLRGKK
jgi:hypothetical protein